MEQEQKQQQLQQEQEQEYRPSIQDGEQRVFDNSVDGAAELMSNDQCDTIQEMDDSQLVGAPATVAPYADSAVKGDVSMVDVEVRNEAKDVEMSTAKRRRGRPPRVQGKTSPPPPPPQRKKKDEEDVCFICFDGGRLVLCDRRGCPKAYHPACIKRDEAFFRSRAKWNCGWHICSRCEKASHYMCYTCTYSLCKGCTKDANYLCVRGNKGFCGTCMRTVMLIENIALGNKEMVQVDFDDKTSWEYLFKVYWMYLKAKLSLTLDELTKAKNPWKGEELLKTKNSWKGSGAMALKGESSGELCHANDEKDSCSDNYCGNLEANHSKRRKTKNQPKFFNENSLVMEKPGVDKVTALPEGTTWATKELLEFVAHMKNGDISVLSHFDVQSLLQEYIKRNNLRDPRQKCQIVCDSRLVNLFGKSHLGHFEMLKLLEYHFLIKEKSPADDAVRAGVADTVCSQAETAGNNNCQLTMGNDRRRKTRKKTDEKEPQINPNPDEYAAVDVHNINLLYLKRSLMENLMDDAEKFHEKVVGSFVRIRISGGDQKQDMYRLVRVVGTSKVAESYKVGTRTTDIMLEILNLRNKEFVSIDVISNQEFSEEECRRLYESIKYGLIKRLTVGEIQEKAMALQAVKVNDWLEAEILRLNHLRDRANEKGHMKELRECVEKLELLKSPDERQLRLLEIPNVHTDPSMDTSYESEADAGESDEKKQGDHMRPRNTGFGRKGAELNPSLRGGDVSTDTGNKPQKNLATTCEQTRNVCMPLYVDSTHVHERVSESSWSQGGEVFGLNSQNTPKNWVGPNGSVTGDWNSQAMVQSESLSGIASPVFPPPLSTGKEFSVNDTETDKLWHYKDPSGKIQGPFSMNHLRKWSIGGLFPFDVRVWRINEKQDDSILLTDALVGGFHKEPPLLHGSYLLAQEGTIASNDVDKKWECGLSQNTDASFVDGKNVDDSWKSVQNDASIHCNGSDELVRSNEWGSHSSNWTTAVDVAIANDKQTQSSLQGWELSKDGNSWSDQTQICSSLTLTSSSGKLCETPSLKVRESHGDEKLSSSPSNVNENPLKTTGGSTRIGESDEKQADSEGYSSQSSGQNWRHPPTKSSSSGWDSNSGFVSVAKSIETSEKNQVIDFSNLPSPAPKRSHEDLKSQAAEKNQSVSSNVPVLDSGPSCTAYSLVVGGAQLPEVAGEWVGYSATPTEPSVEEWDSNLASASSLKPTEGVSDHAATPTPESGPLTHSSTSEPTIDTSIWQPIVPDPNEFSLVDESVSDLLAEVEAMESLGGLPSPTSKMSCGEELTQDSDNHCFSPVEGFSPARDPGKSDALSSTGDIQLPLQLTVTDEPLGASQMPSQLSVSDEQLGASEMPAHSTVTDEPLGLSHTNALNPQKSCSGQSSTSAEVDGDAKPSDVSVNQWEAGSDRQLPTSSTVNQGEPSLDIQPPTSSTVSQWEAGSDIQHPAPSTTDASWGTAKRNANISRGGVARGNANMVWGTGHATIQQHAGTNSATSTGNPGSWGSQPRHGGDRFSGPRDHRNYFQGRDSGFGRDRSSWNRQPLFGVGNGGSSYRPPPKGQRVCKFYESGYCKKGASCSYWHP